MSGNFAPDSCTGEASCAVLAIRMLSVCIDQKIPDVPRGLNPNAGKRFTLARSKKMHAAFARAGCTMPHAGKLKSTPAPTPLATESPSAQPQKSTAASGVTGNQAHHGISHQQSQEAAFENRLAQAKRHYVLPSPAPQTGAQVPAASPEIQAENRQIVSIAIGCGVAVIGFVGFKATQMLRNVQLQAIPPSPRGTEMHGTEEERIHLQYG